MKPVKIELISDTVLNINWDDGHESIYFADHLRRSCPCADCEEKRRLNGDKAFAALKEVKFSAWEVYGNYALSLRFSDGHDTGIYTYDLLRRLCQCDECTGNVIRIQTPLR